MGKQLDSRRCGKFCVAPSMILYRFYCAWGLPGKKMDWNASVTVGTRICPGRSGRPGDWPSSISTNRSRTVSKACLPRQWVWWWPRFPYLLEQPYAAGGERSFNKWFLMCRPSPAGWLMASNPPIMALVQGLQPGGNWPKIVPLAVALVSDSCFTGWRCPSFIVYILLSLLLKNQPS